MPTFKNNSDRYIDYNAAIQTPDGEPKKILIRFKPGEERGLPFWVPYQKLGLELVNSDYPAVPNTILISGTFNFDEDTARKFTIDPCDTYIVNVIVQSGAVKMKTGNSDVGVVVEEDGNVPYHYKATFDWEYAPYLEVIGLKPDTVATIHAEVDRACSNAKVGGKAWL